MNSMPPNVKGSPVSSDGRGLKQGTLPVGVVAVGQGSPVSSDGRRVKRFVDGREAGQDFRVRPSAVTGVDGV